MLLRSIMEHFKAQNWTAVGLDFVLVGVVVFIGIQVANWNAVRQARSDEAHFYKQLHNDLMLAEPTITQTLAGRLRSLELMIERTSGKPIYWMSFHEDHLNTPVLNALISSIELPDFWRERGLPLQSRMIDSLPGGRDYECD